MTKTSRAVGWSKARKFVPDRGTGRAANCQPLCAPWVWQKHTLLVEPTADGLRLVIPPSGIEAKYLRQF